MARRTLLLIASILVAALGTALIWLYVQGADSRAQDGQALVTVYQLSGAVPAGTSAQEVLGRSTPRKVPVALVTGVVTAPQQIQGKVLTYQGVQGQILSPGMFSDAAASGAGQRGAAVAITITDPHRVPALLKPGDRVAVYSIEARSVRLVDKNARVATIGSSTQPGRNGQPAVPVTIVGFDAEPQEALDLLAIETRGQPALVLLGDRSTAAVNPTP